MCLLVLAAAGFRCRGANLGKKDYYLFPEVEVYTGR